MPFGAKLPHEHSIHSSFWGSDDCQGASVQAGITLWEYSHRYALLSGWYWLYNGINMIAAVSDLCPLRFLHCFKVGPAAGLLMMLILNDWFRNVQWQLFWLNFATSLSSDKVSNLSIAPSQEWPARRICSSGHWVDFEPVWRFFRCRWPLLNSILKVIRGKKEVKLIS